MIHSYKLFFSSPYNNLDSIKIAGAVLSSAFDLYPNRSGEIIEQVSNNALAFSDPMPYREMDDDKKSFLMFPVPPLPYSIPKGLSREERIRMAKNRKRSASFTRLPNLIKVVERFLREGITQSEATEIFNDYKKDNDDDNDNFLWNQEMGEYGVSLMEDEPKVYVRDLMRPGAMRFRVINGASILSYDPICVFADFEKDYFKDAISFLQDSGISAFISRGKGKFKALEFNSDIKTGFNGRGYYLLLSKFVPNEDDLTNIQLDSSYYSLNSFTGISRNGKPLAKIKYFNPGSLLYLTRDIKGKSVFINGTKRVLVFHPIVVKILEA